ncbi:MAG: MBL fold metallo-hydrolase [Pseudomonadota bacterium]|nr:MBL fold metallo-hydrolase [Pseudomonadota bacterium]
MTRDLHRLPREIAEGVWWVGGCLESAAFAEPVHFHTSAYLVVGAERSLLFDTAPPAMWPDLDRDLDQILGGRTLDYVVPSHPEIPHAGNLGKLLDKYPAAVATGDLRDYHLYFPDHEDRLRTVPHGTTVELGGGYRFTLLDAIIEDLPNTVWGYEHKQQVLFPVDSLGYGHLPQTAEFPDELLHRAGECALLSSELHAPPALDLATYLTQSSLFWSRYVEITPYMDRLEALMRDYPPRLIAPAHGSVIDDLGVVMPVMREAHRKAFVG